MCYPTLYNDAIYNFLYCYQGLWCTTHNHVVGWKIYSIRNKNIFRSKYVIGYTTNYKIIFFWSVWKGCTLKVECIALELAHPYFLRLSTATTCTLSESLFWKINYNNLFRLVGIFKPFFPQWIKKLVSYCEKTLIGLNQISRLCQLKLGVDIRDRGLFRAKWYVGTCISLWYI